RHAGPVPVAMTGVLPGPRLNRSWPGQCAGRTLPQGAFAMAIPRLIRTPFRRQPPDTGAAFSAWLRTPVGEQLLAEERRVLADVLPRLPGLRALPCCAGTPESLLESSVMPLKWTLGTEPGVDMLARPSQLPLPRQCLDLVLLHHSLDFEDDPHLVLGQVARALQPGGALVVVGFQPLGLWGLLRLFRLH